MRMIAAGFGIALLGLLSGCIPASNIQPVTSMDALGSDSVVVVGRFFLDPALKEEEQDLSMYDEYRNRLIVVTDTRLRDASELGWGDLGRRIEATFGEYFFMEMPKEDFYILKGWVMMNEKGTGNAPLLGQFKVDLQADDRIVYIGDITYHRDAFFRTTKVAVRDSGEAANAAARAHFGQPVSLRKSIVTPVQ